MFRQRFEGVPRVWAPSVSNTAFQTFSTVASSQVGLGRSPSSGTVTAVTARRDGCRSRFMIRVGLGPARIDVSPYSPIRLARIRYLGRRNGFRDDATGGKSRAVLSAVPNSRPKTVKRGVCERVSDSVCG